MKKLKTFYRGKSNKYDNKELKDDKDEFKHLVKFGEMPV